MHGMSQLAADVAVEPRQADESLQPLAVAGVVLCTAAFWLLQHPYEGIVHDSVLYVFSALARMHPESLGRDVFLTPGSQDQYTIFSPVAATAIRLFGVERTAALLAGIAQIAFFGCAWMLARRIMPSVLAVLALGLLVALPGVYGPNHLFSYTEAFMTARVPAEALVLASLASAFGRRPLLSGACMLGAVLLHPLMAAPGIFLLLVLGVALPRPRAAFAVAAGAFVALVAVAYIAPIGALARFDSTWFELLHSRLQYLFPSLWPGADWGHASVPLATLAVGALTVVRPPWQRLCCAALLTGLCGLGLALVGSDVLHIVLIAQLQPWRWLWLSNALAVILIPIIASSCWRAGYATQASVLLLAAAWVCMDESFVPVIAALAIAAAAVRQRVTDPNNGRLMVFGACAVLLLSVMVFAGTLLSVLRRLPYIAPDTSLYDSPFLLLLRQLRPWASGGLLPACLISLAWWVGIRSQLRLRVVAIVALSSGLSAAFVPLAWNAWTHTLWSQQPRAVFAEWRRQIPQDAQILWPDTAIGPWYLLDRPSYWSLTQMAGLVFSRATAMELTRRERLLTHQPAGHTPAQQLEDTHARRMAKHPKQRRLDLMHRAGLKRHLMILQ